MVGGYLQVLGLGSMFGVGGSGAGIVVMVALMLLMGPVGRLLVDGWCGALGYWSSGLVAEVGEVWACGWCVGAAGFGTAYSSVHNSTSYSQIRSFSPTIQQTHQEQGQEEHTRPRQIKRKKMRRDKKRRSARTQKGWGETNARY